MSRSQNIILLTLAGSMKVYSPNCYCLSARLLHLNLLSCLPLQELIFSYDLHEVISATPFTTYEGQQVLKINSGTLQTMKGEHFELEKVTFTFLVVLIEQIFNSSLIFTIRLK